MTRVWEFLAALALFAMFAVLVVHWNDLPDRVPSHFDLAGNPTRWTGPYRLWFMPVLGLGLYVLLTVLTKVRVRYNVPFGLDSSREDVRREARGMLTAMKAVVLLGFAWIHVQVMMIALGLLKSPGPWAMLGLVGATMVVTAVYVWRFRRIARGEA
jgi:uncharacterized membrane protein